MKRWFDATRAGNTDPMLQSRPELDALDAPPAWEASQPVNAASWAAAFDHTAPFTIGVEEELLLVDPDTLELVPHAEEILASLRADRRFTGELRPSQLEIVTRVCATPADAARELAAARRDLLDAIHGRYRLVAVGTHPFSTAWGRFSGGEHYRRIADEYTYAAQRSLACGHHVHVAVSGADRALSVFNALRSYLPELAAIGANSPFFEGRDIGMASIRPKLNEAFPRSGVPPSFPTWEHMLRFANWGRRGGLFPDASHFWWEMRPHLVHGTIEIRVADTQTRVEDAAAVVALIQGLVVMLSERVDAGLPVPVHETHWIQENAWRAHRYGVRGWLVDLDTGLRVPTRERLLRLIEAVAPYAEGFGSLDELAAARVLLAGNGADRQRYVRRHRGLRGVVRWLADETERSALRR